ncbi:MAG: prephenate dehydrogenase [Treponema sp.]|nr:prephenate dehydrogenase [Treponema sp.]
MKTVGIVGLGLMGASFAKALKEKKLCEKIFACDINATVLEKAKNGNIITEGFIPENVDAMLEKCQIVFICLYPGATKKFLDKHKNSFASGAIITDIAGVKSILIDESEKLQSAKLGKAFFIPGHPMAGGEKEGFEYSSANFFNGRNYILLPFADTPPEKLHNFEKLIYDLGFKRIIKTSAKNHDHKIAFTSQLCHVIASGLVQCAEDTNITEFGGGSFEDLTRIAMINAPLWTELFLANKTNLVYHIESFEKSLSQLKNLIETENETDLKNYLQNVREKRIKMI